MQSEEKLQEASGVPKLATRRQYVKASAAGMTLSLAGCLGDSNGDDDVALELNSGIDPDGEPGEHYREALYEAGMSEEIDLNYAGIPPGGERLPAWEQWLSTNREKPDLMQIDSSGPRFIDRGDLLNLSEYISNDVEQEIKERMDHPHLHMYMRDGDLYGVPLLIDVGVMQYRKDLVEEAGYDPEGENWSTNPISWERFNQVIRDVQEETGIDIGFSTSTQHKMASGGFYEMVNSWGGCYFADAPLDENVQDRPVTVDEEPVLNALRMLRTFIHGQDDPHALDGFDKISPSEMLQWTDDPAIDNFVSGRQASFRNWVYSVPIIQEEYGDAVGTMPVPYGVTKDEAAYSESGYGGAGAALGGWVVAANANTEHPEACGEFIEAMVTDHAQLTLFDHQGYSPPATDLYKSDKMKERDIGKHADTIHYIAEEASRWAEVDPLWHEYEGQFEGRINDVLRAERSPEEAMDDLKETILDYQSDYDE